MSFIGARLVTRESTPWRCLSLRRPPLPVPSMMVFTRVSWWDVHHIIPAYKLHHPTRPHIHHIIPAYKPHHSTRQHIHHIIPAYKPHHSTHQHIHHITSVFRPHHPTPPHIHHLTSVFRPPHPALQHIYTSSPRSTNQVKQLFRLVLK